MYEEIQITVQIIMANCCDWLGSKNCVLHNNLFDNFSSTVLCHFMVHFNLFIDCKLFLYCMGHCFLGHSFLDTPGTICTLMSVMLTRFNVFTMTHLYDHVLNNGDRARTCVLIIPKSTVMHDLLNARGSHYPHIILAGCGTTYEPGK